MTGDCTKLLINDIKNTEAHIRLFSTRCEGLSDECVLYEAESLVESIKEMIEQKKIVKENMRYEDGNY